MAMISWNYAPPSDRDLDLAVRVRAFLVNRRVPGAESFDIEAQRGVVTLRGLVASWRQKVMSVRCAARVAGVVTLVDALEVEAVAGEIDVEGCCVAVHEHQPAG
jgi:hypothetical protein